jgi:hypothetical protein
MDKWLNKKSIAQSSVKIEETEIISESAFKKRKLMMSLQQVLYKQNKKVDINPAMKNRKQLHPSY